MRKYKVVFYLQNFLRMCTSEFSPRPSSLRSPCLSSVSWRHDAPGCRSSGRREVRPPIHCGVHCTDSHTSGYASLGRTTAYSVVQNSETVLKLRQISTFSKLKFPLTAITHSCFFYLPFLNHLLSRSKFESVFLFPVQDLFTSCFSFFHTDLTAQDSRSVSE
jgi:hypothetical protein